MSILTTLIASLVLSTNYPIFNFDPLYAEPGREVEVPKKVVIDLSKIKTYIPR